MMMNLHAAKVVRFAQFQIQSRHVVEQLVAMKDKNVLMINALLNYKLMLVIKKMF